MRARSVLFALAVAAATVLAPAAAHAEPATTVIGPEPWQPWFQRNWEAADGLYCDFPLGHEVVSQDIRSRVVERYPDGTKKIEEYEGPLMSEFVNRDTGKRFLVDAGGRGFSEYRPDGTEARFVMIGPVGTGFRDGDLDLPRGYYLFDGFHVVAFAPDGTRSLPVDLGPEHNVCEDLD
ncbi:hypothetical protein [Phytomonospora endophytica]|uniref:Uncharacterized protein n=1 Tax=Phytomonospora endophytica TaxID=714109 RepID=A0A841FHS3_9ACTN|nr:hypothetical protein [Phytomonospora endophytica]MBB6033398.1 hypothetical protein [Phytomonospora endophytica]GIG70831.1 hypothetical protein Pen01_71260 [Phytomonospora endophytica]